MLSTVLCFQEMLEKCMENERERNKEALATAAKVSKHANIVPGGPFEAPFDVVAFDFKEEEEMGLHQVNIWNLEFLMRGNFYCSAGFLFFLIPVILSNHIRTKTKVLEASKNFFCFLSVILISSEYFRWWGPTLKSFTWWIF